MSFFEDPLEGLKLFLEFTNEILEDDKKFEDNEEDDDEEEMVE